MIKQMTDHVNSSIFGAILSLQPTTWTPPTDDVFTEGEAEPEFTAVDVTNMEVNGNGVDANGDDRSPPLGELVEQPTPPLLPEHDNTQPPCDPPEGYTWWHLDTGATAPCTFEANDLSECLPTRGYCGTAAKGALNSVIGIGSSVMELGGHGNQPSLSFQMDNILVVPSFTRRSLSLHFLKRCGFECAQRFMTDMHSLWIHCISDGIEYEYPTTTAHGTDFIAIRLNPDLRRSPDIQLPRVSAIMDLTKNMSDDALFILLHLRMGCAPPSALRAMRDGGVDGFPPGVKIPDVFTCPICAVQKTTSLPHRKMIPMQVAHKGI